MTLRYTLPLVVLSFACAPADVSGQESSGILPELPGLHDPLAFAAQHPTDYWYQGAAELSRYALIQARYGEEHPGEAVLIFVTEDFHAIEQVKYEGGDRDGVVSVLKLNHTRNFDTGVYNYALMTSAFVPAAGGRALKVTNSVQDWCGMTFTQLNSRDDGWHAELRSYFASEGDQETLLGEADTEDGLFTRLRLGPADAPTGSLTVVPALHHVRFAHLPLEALPAVATFALVDTTPRGAEDAALYSIAYQTIDRRVDIWLEPGMPYRVLAWQETTPQAGGASTTALLRESIVLDYWNHHDLDDAPYREALGR